MFHGLRLGIGPIELAKRTVREVIDDDCMGMAAQLAYYLALALFPAMLFLVALASYLPYQIIGDIISTLEPIAPPEVLTIIRKQLESIVAGEQSGILTVGVLGALWSSSAAMTSIVSGLNKAYDVPESRPWWKVRLVAIGLTAALAVFVLLAFSLVIAGPEAGRWVADRVGLGGAFDTAWMVLRWPVVFALVTFAIALVFYYAPDADQDWVWITPGCIVATILWILFSLGFRIYVTEIDDYNATYGALTGAIILLLWLYFSSLAILIGGELNSELEHAANPELKTQTSGRRSFRAFSRQQWSAARTTAHVGGR
jgi:membrane protein